MLAAACLSVLLVAPTMASAEEGPDGEPAEEPTERVAGDALAEARELLPATVRNVRVSSAAVDRAEAEIVALEQTILTNRARRDQAASDLERLAVEREELREERTSLRDRRHTAGQQAAQLRREQAQLAVAAYVGAGDPAPGLTLDSAEAMATGRQQVMMEAVDTTIRERLEIADGEVVAFAARITTTQEEIEAVVLTIDTTTRIRDEAIAELAIAEPELPRAQQRFADAFMTAPVAGADFPVVALDAYRSAADVINAEQAACNLSWSVLAGIGRVESRHGTYGGSSLRPDGTTTRRIIGIALDGSEGVMLIPDTDGGALDGDPIYDRAVGPMQFIPSTWRMVRRDGNGDGRMDPHNLYDAAAAAGAYLCRNHQRLDQPGPLNSALLSYNRSQSYVNTVLAHRRTYDNLGVG